MRLVKSPVTLSQKYADVQRGEVRGGKVEYAVVVEVCSDDNLRLHSHRVKGWLLELGRGRS